MLRNQPKSGLSQHRGGKTKQPLASRALGSEAVPQLMLLMKLQDPLSIFMVGALFVLRGQGFSSFPVCLGPPRPLITLHQYHCFLFPSAENKNTVPLGLLWRLEIGKMSR